jgi:glutathione S-transferase
MNLVLYDMPASGHCHRVRLFLSILGLEYEKRPMSTRAGKTMPADYVALNPLGQVPTLIDGEVVITDSTAALVYLAKKYGDARWLPEDPAGAAAVQRWLSTASGELYRGPTSARAALRFGRELDVEAARGWAIRLFDWMQAHLENRQWLAADHATIADLAMYAYVRVANEGNLDISPYPSITRWLASVEALDGFEPMPREEKASQGPGTESG